MAKTKVGIVEDDMLIAAGIVMALNELGYDTTEPAISYTEALEMIRAEQPDILLLDIQLSGRKDGIDLAARLKEDGYTAPFIFLTANSDAATVARAKSLHPPAYLLKPFSKEDLYTSIEICLHNAAARKAETDAAKDNYLIRDALFVKQGQHFQKVKLDDILYLESDNVYIHLHTRQGKLLVRSTIQHYLEIIGARQFFRVHRSFAVNTDHIDSINADSLFIGQAEIPVSKMYRDELLSFFRLG